MTPFSLPFPRPTFPAHTNFTSNIPRLFYCSRWNLRLAPSAHDVAHLDFWPRRRPQSHKSISSPVKISREYLDSPVIMGTWFWSLTDGKSGNLFPRCCNCATIVVIIEQCLPCTELTRLWCFFFVWMLEGSYRIGKTDVRSRILTSSSAWETRTCLHLDFTFSSCPQDCKR